MFGVTILGISGLVLLALFGLRPIILKIENKDVDETFSFKHYNTIKLSMVLTAATIIIIYGISDFYFHTKIESDFLLKMILPYSMLIHGCVGTIYFRN
jgi:hypothetical protein